MSYNSWLFCNCFHSKTSLLSKVLLEEGHYSAITGELLETGHVRWACLPQQLHNPLVPGKKLIWKQCLSAQRPTALGTLQWALVNTERHICIHTHSVVFVYTMS